MNHLIHLKNISYTDYHYGNCEIMTQISTSVGDGVVTLLVLNNCENENKNVEEKYDLENEKNKWRHIGDLPVAVPNFSVLNNYILIIGGDLCDLKCGPRIYMYNISNKIWKLLHIKLPDHLYETLNDCIHIFAPVIITLLHKEFDEFDSSMSNTNLNLLDKLAQALQETEENSYEMIEINRTLNHNISNDKNNKNIKPKSPQNKNNKFLISINNNELIHEMNLQNNGLNNLSIDKINMDPKFIAFRNFLYHRIGLSKYLIEFKITKYNNICKISELNDEKLKLKIGISNELHRKLLLKTINEFNLEILQFKTRISAYNNESTNLIHYVKLFNKYGIIT